ncbi:FAD binding domain-containing protein [Zychaea mexicana]|uniref:FAD binding domain-containing protein n=1 Tax=Zychaea mexicana TaxID=64656 RepID=UPI0022FE16A0|nr:FAD binding domain-containing protein [Zychaea mexicana]KAI9499420.1 FAD binding domain-containing protein [Zychaea mexicana]
MATTCTATNNDGQHIENRVDVFISGAGPVGLFFAYQMAKLGHSVYICDPKNGPTTQSRAVLLTPRTMEVMANHNIAHHLLKEAIVVQGVQIHVQGSKVGTMDVTGDTSFPQMTCLAQDITETVLIRLVGSDCIAWHTQLIDYSQDEDHIEAIVRHTGTGFETKVLARYIIGADGSHSVVRKKTENWNFVGYSMATRFGMGDVALTGKDASKLPYTRANGFVHSNGMCGAIPIGKRNGKQYFRVVGNLGPYEVDESDRTTHGVVQEEHGFTLEQLQNIMTERLHPLEVVAQEPLWLTEFRINERKANGFRRKRAFLIGDAAHCHSPVGGQGLNLGLQDADNLAWKLSIVLRGLSSDDEKILDSYVVEREPIVAATLQTTGSATRFALTKGPILSAVGYLLSGALSFDRIKNYFIVQMMQVHVRLPKESQLLHSANSSSNKHNSTDLIEPGNFMPDTSVLRKRVLTSKLERCTLHQILATDTTTQHAVMWISSRPSRFPSNPLTQEFWTKFFDSKYPSATVRPMVIESTWHVHESKAPEFVQEHGEQASVAETAFWSEDHWDTDGSISKRVNLGTHMYDKPDVPAAIVILRPDLYVAYSNLVRSSSDIDKAFEFLGAYLKKEDGM